MSGHEAVDSYFMADSKRTSSTRPGWRGMPRKGRTGTEEFAKVKYTGFVRICLTVAAMIVLHQSGARSFGETPQRAGVSTGGQVFSSSALYRTSHFLVSSGDASPTSSALGDLLEMIHARLLHAMARHGLALDVPSQPLIWVCSHDRGQDRRHSLSVEHVGAVFREAYYSTRTNQVVLCSEGLIEVRDAERSDASPLLVERESRFPDGSYAFPASSELVLVLTHEMTHQLAYNSGLQKRGVMYPLWVSEGLATFFEGSALPQWDPIGNTGRRRTLAKLHAGEVLLPLHELSVLAGSDALGSAPADVYAQCWGLLGFLLTHHPDALSAYLADLSASPMGRRSSVTLRRDFVRHFGSIGVLEQDWLKYVADLSSETSATGGSVATAVGL